MAIQQALPLYKQAYEAIKKSILTGEYPTGSRLVVTQLAEVFQVSRTPIREALRSLENEGLLVQDKMGATIIELDKNDYEDLCECRLALERQIIRSVIYTIPNEKLTELKNILNEVEQLITECEDLKILEMNTKFHEIIIEASPNKRLIDLLHQVRSKLLLYRAKYIIKEENYHQEMLSEHRDILEQMNSRSVDKAIKSIENHLFYDKKRGIDTFKN